MDTPDRSEHVEEAEPEAPRAQIAPTKRDVLVERWFAKSFHGSPHMRDTDTFNHVRRAVDELKTLLAQEA